jgi:diguanylate cyclase (GGDEF)-like protein
MIPEPNGPTIRLRRELLLASFGLLLLPAALAILGPEGAPDRGFLWFLGLLPVLLWGYAFRWRGAAAALTVALSVLVLAETTGAARGSPSTPGLGSIVVSLVLITGAIGYLVERMWRDRGDLEEVALTDRLTSLPNRRHARVFLETMFGAAERGRPVSVVLFDLDGFRPYNARMGEREGDDALRAFAQLLSASTRRMNLSARLGGEEFMSILSGADEEGARAFADRVRETFRLSRPASRELTVSAGVASFHPSMHSPDELVGAADLALFRAKEQGGDRVRVFGRDVRSSDIEGVRSTASLVDRADADGAPEWSGTDFARDPADMGSSPPPPELLPPGDPRFGTGRSLVLIEGTEAPSGTEDGHPGIREYLEREGFAMRIVEQPSHAHAALAAEADLILLDLDFMATGAGDFIRAAKSRWPATQLLTLSDDTTRFRGTDGVAAGADEALARPVELRLLQSSLVDALARRDRLREEARARSLHPTFSEATSSEGERLLHRGLMALVRAGELRDPNTRGHARRVARYSAILLDQLEEDHGISRDALVRSCFLHDIGKLEIPEAILVKNAPLTAEEFGKVRRHPAVGREILKPLVDDPLTLAITGWHHERWDGSGYPDGLSGEAIPLAARIVAIADALDAMTSARAYRAGLAWEDAARQVRERFGSHYDPGLEEPFRRALPELHRAHHEG